MDLKLKLKTMLVEGLDLKDLNPAEIEDDAPLFGAGLGLDSLDAVELIILVQKNFGIEIKDMEEGKEAFKSIASLAAYIEQRSQA